MILRVPHLHLPRRQPWPQEPRSSVPPGRVLRVARACALVAITALVTASAAASFTESYRGLYDWATEHGLSGVWALGFPLQVDVFIAVGELALFVALADGWARRSRAGAWAVTLAGLAVSIAGNVGHVAGHALTNRATAAVPPLAAAAALAVGLGVLKRVVQHHHANATGEMELAAGPAQMMAQPEMEMASGLVSGAPGLMARKPAMVRQPGSRRRDPAMARKVARATDAYRDSVAAGTPLSERELDRRFGIGRRRAGQVRAAVAQEGNGHREGLPELVAAVPIRDS